MQRNLTDFSREELIQIIHDYATRSDDFDRYLHHIMNQSKPSLLKAIAKLQKESNKLEPSCAKIYSIVESFCLTSPDDYDCTELCLLALQEVSIQVVENDNRFPSVLDVLHRIMRKTSFTIKRGKNEGQIQTFAKIMDKWGIDDEWHDMMETVLEESFDASTFEMLYQEIEKLDRSE